MSLAQEQLVLQAIEEKLQKKTIEFLTDQVKDRLKDPNAASCRTVTLFRSGESLENGRPGPGGDYRLCGEVNAKNAFGGYVGYHRFVATVFIRYATEPRGPVPDTIRVDFERPDDEDYNRKVFKLWYEDCKNELDPPSGKP